MATTQQIKPTNGGKNAVLKPLNIGTKAGFRTRRTSDQVTEAKVKRNQEIAAKAKAITLIPMNTLIPILTVHIPHIAGKNKSS